jgi:hypothetical protein
MDKETVDKIVELRKSGLLPKEIGKNLNITNIQEIRAICHMYKVSEDKNKIKKAYHEELSLRAVAYWKDQKQVPDRNSLAWLLIPKFGLDMAQKMLAVRTYLKDEPQMRKYLFGVD